MSFVPALPASGLVGWRFLERTEAAQRATLVRSPEIARDMAHFRDRIAGVRSVEELLGDRRLLRVALGAFGLEGEIDRRALLRKVLAEGSERADAFARRLTDRRFRELAATFGFGNARGVRTGDPGFADRLLARYEARRFETAVGDVDAALGQALAYRRAIPGIAAAASERAVWFGILGDREIRTVLATALGLPEATARIEIDAQATILAERARRLLGVTRAQDLARPETVDRTLRLYLARAPAADPGAGSGALALLRAGAGLAAGTAPGASAAGLFGLLLAR